MPHKPNPIPRFNAATNPPSQYHFPSQTPAVIGSTTSGPRREHPTVPPRHRASSWTSQSSQGHDAPPPTTGSAAGSRSGGNSGSGGGTRSGRTLPPPRFQRKQRPPRVQQALAAANNSQNSSNPRSGGSGRRDGAINVPSLSMATINAASARGSILQRQQQLSNPPPVDPRSLEPMGLDEDDYEDITLTGYDDLDPVQLHNQITFGMSRTNDASMSTDSLQPISHESILGQVVPSPDIFIPTYPPAPVQSAKDTSRARSFSHNMPQGHLQHHAGQLTAHHPHVPSPIAVQSPYASSFGVQTPPGIDASLRPTLEEGQSRMRSKSLMSPVEEGALLKSSHSHHLLHVPLPQMPAAVGGYDGPQTIERPSVPDSLLGTEPPSTDYSTNGARKPLKSALKVRSAAPGLVDTALANTNRYNAAPPPFTQSSSPGQVMHTATGGQNNSAMPLSSNPNDFPGPIPDSQFTLPDSLQAQYAHQLRLLQDEYASKAAKAERVRQRSIGRGKASPRSLNAVPSRVGSSPGVIALDTVPLDPAGGYNQSAQGRAPLDPLQGLRGRATGEKLLLDDGYASWDDRWVDKDGGPGEMYGHPRLGGGSGNLPSDVAPAVEHTGSDSGRSDIGDRGHEDAPSGMDHHSATVSHDGDRAQPPSFEVSPVGAIAHGHESSSSISSNALSTAGHDMKPSSPAVQVEITAPTPVLPVTELEEHGETPAFTVVHPRRGFVPGKEVSTKMATATGSEESVSTDSNRTFTRAISPSRIITHQLPSTPFDSSSTVHPEPLEVSLGAITAQSGGSTPSSMTGDLKHGFPVGEVAPRPSLQRLAQRISRGASNTSPVIPVSSSPLPSQLVPTNKDLESQPTTYPYIDEDVDAILHSLRTVSIHPSSPNNAAAPQSLFGSPLGRINEQIGMDASSPSDSHLSHGSLLNSERVSLYGPRERRSTSSLLSQGSQAPQYRPMRALVMSETGSAVSVESGSSHGALTSVSGHSHGFPSKKAMRPSSMAQSSTSHESHQSSRSQFSAGAIPSPVQQVIKPEENTRYPGSTPPLAPSNPSGKISTGESIWTLGKDESSWPKAPSSAGSHSTQSRGVTPFTLGALIPSNLLSEPESPPSNDVDPLFSTHLSDHRQVLHDSDIPPPTSRNFTSNMPHDAPTLQHSFHPQRPLPSSHEFQGRTQPYVKPHEIHTAKSMPNIDATHTMARSHPTRLHQLRSEAETFVPPSPEFGRLPRQSSSSSLPLSPASREYERPQWNEPPPSFSGGMGVRAFGSVHSHYTDPGSRMNTIMLPASGGVFPRFQEIPGPPYDVGGRPGGNGGKLKSLFKPRDAKVFK